MPFFCRCCGIKCLTFFNLCHLSCPSSRLFEGGHSQYIQVSNLANAASLIYNSLLAFPPFGSGHNAVNWCGKQSSLQAYRPARQLVRTGFYIHSSHFPRPPADHAPFRPETLILGPFCGKPACQLINLAPTNPRGVCADAFLRKSSILVPDVHAYPGHIACDGETKSELVVPLILQLDCLTGANQVSRMAGRHAGCPLSMLRRVRGD